MTITNRTVTIKSVFATTANTVIPNPPVVGESYRNESTTATEIGKGWPYKNIVDSAKFNQVMYEYSTITKLQEKYGFIPWSDLTDYEVGSVCLGTDGKVYQAKQNTGPSSTAYDPVNDTTHTYWQILFTDIPNYVQTILEAIYPVGALYIGTQSTCPMGALIPDSTWALVAKDKALWTGDGTNGNTTIAAGLPNITGSFAGDGLFDGGHPNSVVSGAFEILNLQKAGADGYGSQTNQIQFDASLSNAIYGASDTVQPPAYVVNVWRRTA